MDIQVSVTMADLEKLTAEVAELVEEAKGRAARGEPEPETPCDCVGCTPHLGPEIPCERENDSITESE